MKPLTFKIALCIGVTLASIVWMMPTFYNIWPHKKINLGLDLQGGLHLVLEVQSIKAVETEVERIIQDMKKQLRDDGTKHSGISRQNDNSILAKFEGEKDKSGFEATLSKYYKNLVIDSSQAENNISTYVLKLPENEIAEIKKMAAHQALETIRNRIDEFGVSEPDIRIQGENRILLQLPGVKDPERAKALIGKTAQLTFQLVDDDADMASAMSGSVPAGDEILYQEKINSASGATAKTPYLIQKRVLLDGSLLTNARVEFDNYQRPQVGIEFDRQGAKIFDRITGENIHKRLAIILDKTVYSAPVIQDRIAGGKAVITGSFTLNEAKDLAIALRAGSLPAPVNIIEERTVGPSLGADSIRMGLLSTFVGGLFVVLFMAVYYKKAGMIANFGLIVNMLMIGGGLAAFQATLTLPGIAGIILTIGMAVDANVLIYERIKEEIKIGKTALAAVNAGFERAAVTIIDSNLTTLIAAVVLYQFGTGPIKGFAVTLTIGLIASLFTALILARVLFDLALKNNPSLKLSI